MGQCLCLVAKQSDGVDEEEEVDGAAAATVSLLMDSVVADALPVRAVPTTMRDNEVGLIERQRATLVANTTQINLERVLLELRLWIPADKANYFKCEDIGLERRLNEFYTYVQSLPVNEPYSKVTQAFHDVECTAVHRILILEAPRPTQKRFRPSTEPNGTNNGNEETDFCLDEQDDILINNNGTTELNMMKPEEMNLIKAHMESLIANTSKSNLDAVLIVLQDNIPTDLLKRLQSANVELEQRIREFYTFITEMRAEDPFVQLVAAFSTVENPNINKILKGAFPRPHPKRIPTKRTRPFNIPGEMLEEMNESINQHSGDDSQVNINLQKDVDTAQLNPNRIRVKPAIKRLDLHANELENRQAAYKCGSNPKGLALILNIHAYDRWNNEDWIRTGSEHDRRDLQILFDQLGYEVVLYPKDLHQSVSEQDFREQIRKFSKRVEHFHLDSCFVVIMAHGEELETSGRGNAIVTSEHNSVPVTWIKSQFTSKECPALIGKPKVFIYQACRGSQKPSLAVNPYSSPGAAGRISIDGKGNINTEEKPVYERMMDDILVCYASPLGYVAHRDDLRGSHFIQAVLDVFTKHAHEMHVRKMMDRVDDLIKVKCLEQKVSQTSCIESIGFTKKLFINPDLYDEDAEPEQNGATAKV